MSHQFLFNTYIKFGVRLIEQKTERMLPSLLFPSLLPLLLLFIVSFILQVPMFLGEDDYRYTNCNVTFECGRIKNVTYPFWGHDRPSYCGHPDFQLDCMDDDSSHVQIYSIYDILDINQANHVARFRRKDIAGSLCSMLYVNATFTYKELRYVPHDVNLTLFYHCPPMKNIPEGLACPLDGVRKGLDGGFRLAFSSEPEQIQAYTRCRVRFEVTVLQEAIQRWDLNPLTTQNASTIEGILKEGFDVEYDGNITYCSDCQKSGGRCGYDWILHQPECFCSYGPEKTHCSVKGRNRTTKALIGVGAGLGSILLTCIVFIVYKRLKRKRSSSSSALISRDLSRDSSSLKPDPEKGGLFFETKLFTYKELDEATNHFDSSKELGDGGFGTVYHGKLHDGRVVAVKRLYEHNYKRVEQFMNEIEILSRLRHQNLVSLYGCTSHHSRELLLVYEFVPNGTVADHLHGERAEEGLLTWPIRMSIAIQSADALAYLHASETIHRDVKSNNILLDNNFHVKVADFGLSRDFPKGFTHVSTAPQGTPGYVDPEYYQCYQLTNKSDVYSFGVVLIELISSKPAVDIGRHRHEINLANMAVNRIHNQALHELVDPSLGYDTDYSVRNMITLVAELAFRCLQQENEMRPCMTEVLEILRGIEKEEYKKIKTDDMDTSAVARLLKTSEPLSPDTVTGKWPSKNTTPNTSG